MVNGLAEPRRDPGRPGLGGIWQGLRSPLGAAFFAFCEREKNMSVTENAVVTAAVHMLMVQRRTPEDVSSYLHVAAAELYPPAPERWAQAKKRQTARSKPVAVK